MVDSSLKSNIALSCEPVISMPVLFTPGFSQVAMLPSDPKPFKRFPGLIGGTLGHLAEAKV